MMTPPASMVVATVATAALLPVQPVQTAPREERKPTQKQIAGLDPTSRGESERLMLEIAREYRSYQRVSDWVNWAPTLCRSLPPSGVQESASGDEDTHGRKLYFLFASDDADYRRLAYRDPDSTPPAPYRAALGQVIVKESFVPVEVKGENVATPTAPSRYAGSLPEDHTRGHDGRIFRTGDAAGLFIMAKVSAEEAKGTDNGWVYATVSPDLKSVTAFGRIASCMECHTATTHDRLFAEVGATSRRAHPARTTIARSLASPLTTPRRRARRSSRPT